METLLDRTRIRVGNVKTSVAVVSFMLATLTLHGVEPGVRLMSENPVLVATLVIGMVLGPTLEISLRQGLIITDGSFLAFFIGHPIAAVLICIAFAMLLLPLIRARKVPS